MSRRMNRVESRGGGRRWPGEGLEYRDSFSAGYLHPGFDCDRQRLAQGSRVSDEKRRIVAVPEEPFFKWLFYIGQGVVLVVGFALAIGSIFWGLNLSWPLLAAVAVALLPFLLPLVVVYVGEMSGIKFNELPRAGMILPVAAPKGDQPEQGAAPQPPPGPVAAEPAASEPQPLPVQEWPHPSALAPEEKKVLRTLWKEQSQYIAEGRKEYWGFVVGPNATDYGEFVRGYSSLAQRRFVMQGAKNIVFLTKTGIEYCKLNAQLIDMNGDAWTRFMPV